MGSDPVRGKTIRWTYEDGPMAGKSFEHVFGEDGEVTWHETDRRTAAKPPTNGQRKVDKRTAHTQAKYQVARVNDSVYVVSCLAGSGYTLTSVLDFADGTVVSFASNEKELVLQRGTFEVAERIG